VCPYIILSATLFHILCIPFRDHRYILHANVWRGYSPHKMFLLIEGKVDN